MEENITYEVCPHCDHEVELPNTLGVHKCPNCGKYIVSCSMCLASNDCKAVCTSCPLCYFADKMNEKEKGEDLKNATNDLFNLIGYDTFPLNEIEYAGANGVGKALSIRIVDKHTHSVVIGYDVKGFLFTEVRNMSELIYTDFLAYVMSNIETAKDVYNILYNKAYQPTSCADSDMPRALYFDETDNIPFHTLGTIVEIVFQKNIEMGTDVKIVYKNLFGNFITVDTCLASLPFTTLGKLEDFVNKEETRYNFRGTITIRLNNATGYGRNYAEALRNAKEEIDSQLTCYGNIDTQIDDYDKDIKIG